MVPGYVAYYSVSVHASGRPLAGLEGQQAAVKRYLGDGKRKLLADFKEAAGGRGGRGRELRPALHDAMAFARKHGAKLLIPKLDRLLGDLRFISDLVQSKVPFVCCELPEANQLTIHLLAALARHKHERISHRMRVALAAKKARGGKVGNPGPLRRHNRIRQEGAIQFAELLRPRLKAYIQAGLTQRRMVEALNEVGIKAANGGRWSLVQLQRVLTRLGL